MQELLSFFFRTDPPLRRSCDAEESRKCLFAAKTMFVASRKIWTENHPRSVAQENRGGEMASLSLRKSVRVACAARSGGSTTTSARSAGLLRRTPSWAAKRLHQQRRLPRVKALEEGKARRVDLRERERDGQTEMSRDIFERLADTKAFHRPCQTRATTTSRIGWRSSEQRRAPKVEAREVPKRRPERAQRRRRRFTTTPRRKFSSRAGPPSETWR